MLSTNIHSDHDISTFKRDTLCNVVHKVIVKSHRGLSHSSASSFFSTSVKFHLRLTYSHKHEAIGTFMHACQKAREANVGQDQSREGLT